MAVQIDTNHFRGKIRRGIACAVVCFAACLVFAVPAYVNASTINRPMNILGLQNGLLGWWTFDGKDMPNGLALDRSGQGNNGYLVNAATSTEYIAGRMGQALNFDGATNYVDIANSSGVADNLSNFTVGACIKTTASTGNIPIISKVGSGGFTSGEGWMLYRAGTRVGIQLQTNVSNYSVAYDAGLDINDGKWHHVAAVISGSSISAIYIDGISRALTSSSGGTVTSYTNSSNIRIANDYNSELFQGGIDDARVYNRVLSASEINQLYTLGTAGHVNTSVSTPGSSLLNGLVGWWTFDGKDTLGGTIYDRSGNGNSGNATGYATSTFYTTGEIGQALNFNGLVTNAVQFSNAASLKGLSTASVSAWVNPSVVPPSNDDIYVETTNGSAIGGLVRIGIVTAASGVVGCRGRAPDSGGVQILNTASAVLSANTWTHIVCTWNVATNSVIIYINGAAVSTSGTISFTNTSLDNTAPGSISIDTFPGKVDDLRVYSRILSATEIKQLYSAGTAGHVNASVITPGSSLLNGLLGWWTFDGRDMPSGLALDRSGQGNNGYLVNAATSTEYIAGRMGQALNFDGATNYVDIANSSGIMDNLSNFTAAAWIKTTASTGNIPIVCKLGVGGYTSGRGWMFFRSGSNLGMFMQTDASDWVQSITSGVNVSDGEWHQVSTVVSGGVISALYIDGISRSLSNASAGTLGTFSNTSNIRIANDYNSELFTGGIDDVRVYNRALSSAEMSQLYNLGH